MILNANITKLYLTWNFQILTHIYSNICHFFCRNVECFPCTILTNCMHYFSYLTLISFQFSLHCRPKICTKNCMMFSEVVLQNYCKPAFIHVLYSLNMKTFTLNISIASATVFCMCLNQKTVLFFFTPMDLFTKPAKKFPI